MTQEDFDMLARYKARSQGFVPNYERIPQADFDAIVSNMKDGDETSGQGVDDLDGDDDSYPPRCSNPGGHDWVISEETDRCYCLFCGADGDA
jgi:hypothetical protein